MNAMSQPNFLQVTNALENAVSFCENNTAYRCSRSYSSRLMEVRSLFASATRRTDTTYTNWRVLVGEELRQFREIRLEYGRIVALCDEHGYDGVPNKRIVYTEREHLLALVAELVSWLTRRSSEWEWIPVRLAALKGLVESADRKRKESQALYVEYTVTVKQRVSAYEIAVMTLKEFRRDARADVKSLTELAATDLYAL
jgi:hypothetical protein